MGRSVLAVLAGVVLWAVAWLGFNAAMQAAFPEVIDPTTYLGHVPTLLAYLAVSFGLSVGAGSVAGGIARSRPLAHGVVLGVVQLVMGIGFEVSYWELLPVWYHLLFLALLVPGNALGGYLVERRREASRAR
jgi:hypothetical protein